MQSIIWGEREREEQRCALCSRESRYAYTMQEGRSESSHDLLLLSATTTEGTLYPYTEDILL